MTSLENLDDQTQSLINEKMREATTTAKSIREKEIKDKENKIDDLVITDLHGQDIVTGSYRLFSRSLENSVTIPCAIKDNDDKETILFFPRDPKGENNLFLGMRAGNRIEWRSDKSTVSMSIPENRGDHNSPIFIKSVSITYKHILTHQKIYARFWEIECDKIFTKSLPKTCIKINRKDIFHYPVPKLIENYLNSKGSKIINKK